ncbi:MAG: sigma-70 family RNA polymerase sigma factor, partial [Clostridiales bacterium]|nr:sigma-70 family RNA polymerase sigma factor [Clostridiales bacterium]
TEYHRKMSVDAEYILGGGKGEDAASAVMLKLVDYSKKESTHIKSPDAFMRTLVKHTAIDMLRADRPFVELKEEDEAAVDKPDEADLGDVMLAIGRLSEQQREIAVMFYIYGIKIKEIAVEFNMPVGTVKWHLNQIRKNLAAMLK